MKLKNYTSNVKAEKSISEIEELLVQAGAKTISKFYDDNNSIAGFFFQLLINNIPHTFKLPSNPKAVESVMAKSIKKPHRGTLERIKEQARKTSWRLLKEWIHIQITMIQLEQAEASQIFLPYIYDGKTDKTLFEKLKSSNFKQLTQQT